MSGQKIGKYTYKECTFQTCPREESHPWNIFVDVPDVIPRYVLDDLKEHLQGYYGAITAMDYNVDRLLDELESSELRENLLICFMSDNGFNCGHHGIWGKGNGTYPKNMFDTSVKIPAIISHPSVIEENSVSDYILSGYDVMPTLLSYAGIHYENPEKPGIDFSGILK